MKERNPPELRQSTYNIVIPLSPVIVKSDGPLYFLCNPLSGKVSILDQKEFEIFNTFPSISDPVVSQLKDAGHLTTLTEHEEKLVMEKRYEAQKKPRNPAASISVTYQCNLRCTYCWTDFLFKHDAKWVNTIIDEKTVDAAYDAIPKIPLLQSTAFMSLYGGEPFLPSTASIVEYILRKGSERDFRFHANTNGYYLEQFVPLLARHQVEGLGVTLDGCAETHDARRKRVDGSGTFHKIVKGIDRALDAGIPLGVRINVDAENFSQLPAFEEWITEHGWAAKKDITFVVAPVLHGKEFTSPSLLSYDEAARQIINLTEEQPSLFKLMYYEWEYMTEGFLPRAIMAGDELKPRPFYCSASCQGFGFDPFGDIYSCPRGVGDKTFSIGRFIPELEFNGNYELWFGRDVLSIPTCRECDLALVCGGGCSYEAYLRHNTIYEGHCDCYKAFVKYGIPLFVRKLLEVQKTVRSS